MAAQRPLDAYVCHGVEDAGWARVLAGRLFQADLEVFLDQWQPEDDALPLRLAQGSTRSRCAVLVLGPDTARPAILAQYEALTLRHGHQGGHQVGQPRCVLVLHGGVQPPPFAVEHIDLSDASAYDQRVEDLVRLIGPPVDRPPLQRRDAAAGTDRPRSALLSIGERRVACVVTGGSDDAGATYGADLTVDGHRFSALTWSQQRHESEALRAIGTALGATFTPDPVGRALEDAADEAYALGTTLAVGITTVTDTGSPTRPHADDEAGDLADLPWETLILPGHNEPLALHPATRIYRTYHGSAVESPDGAADVPGPLRILVAIAGPDSKSLVDHERELTVIMDAVEPARRYHGAYVRVLNESTLDAIGAACAEQPFHVLHLSCHGRAGALLLDDAHGHPCEVTPQALADAIPGVALVVLSGSWATAPGPQTLSAVARSLLSAGVAQVIAMTAPVSDRYATSLCAGVYRELSLAAHPDVLAALAHARRTAEAQRRTEVAVTGRPAPAEWATPALYLRGLPAPLYRPAETEPLPAPPSTFVGRRQDLRRLLTALRQPESTGVLLHGIAGAGKSVLAAEAVRLLGGESGVVVSTSGQVTAAEVTAALSAVPSAQPVLLVMDGIEANLAGTAVVEPELAALLADWANGSGRGRLILTTRDPIELPGGAHRRLWHHHVGPLSWPEARGLIWHLRALDTLTLADQHRSYVDVGGHPGSLRILDLLLRRPGASFPEVRLRMERLLRDRKIDRPELWMAQTSKHGVDASLAEAVTLAVHANLLADLAAAPS